MEWCADRNLGVLGLLSVASYSFLISITQRQQVAQILSKPIYAITNVGVIPLSSQAEASKAIVQAKRSVRRRSGGESVQSGEDSDYSDSEALGTSLDAAGVGGANVDHEVDDMPASPESSESLYQVKGGREKRDSIAEDVIGRKGRYGRFASHWFSKKGWSAEKRSSQGMSSTGSVDAFPPLAPVTAATATTATSFDDGKSGNEVVSNPRVKEDVDEQTSKLLPKLLQYTKMLFRGKHFYMSYDYDITRRFGVEDMAKSYLPMHRVADPLVRTVSCLLSLTVTLTME